MDETKRRRLWKATAIVVAAILAIAAGWVVWDGFLRPRTIHEVIEGGSFQPGTALAVEGTITAIHREDTSYGPMVYLELDGYNKSCAGGSTPFAGNVRGDPATQYRIGDRFETTLHFAAYRFNGDAAVWAPELVCPFPSIFRAIGAISDSISNIRGILLVYNGTDAGGWATYEIMTAHGDGHRPSVLPVTLRKSLPIVANNPELPQGATIDSGARWLTVAALQYVITSGWFRLSTLVDEMASLASATSRNGTLRFADVNGNGFVDDGDHVDVHLPGNGSDNDYETYMLQIGEVNEVNGTAAAYTYAGHYILNGPHGPLETLPSSRTDLRIVLRYAGDQIGTRVTSSLEVAAVRFGAHPPLSDTEISWSANDSFRFDRIADLPAVLSNGATLSFVDGGQSGLLDPGDRFIVGNLENRTRGGVTLIVGGVNEGGLSWIAGYGPVSGDPPAITLTPTGAGPYRVDVNVSFWHPELAFKQSVRVSLSENSTALFSDLVLANGTVGTFSGGTLSFTDADGDGFLSSGDSFTLQGNPTARYELKVSLYFGAYWQRTTFGA